MKNLQKWAPALWSLAAVVFFVSAVLGKNTVFYPLACCFFVLGITTGLDRKNGGKKE